MCNFLRQLSKVAITCLWLFTPAVLQAQTFSPVVIWSEPALPSADSAVATSSQLAQIFPQARLASTEQLPTQLQDASTRLLILPQGSVIPEAAWPSIYTYLQHGGNLLVLGGRPFTRSAYHDAAGWHLREASVRFARALLIDQYQATPGSAGLDSSPNPDFPLQLPRFAWQKAYSPIIRLSTTNLYNRGGSTGTLDVRLDPLVWGVSEGRRLAAPVIELDHLSSGFDGGRWILLSAELDGKFYSAPDSITLLRSLAERAMRGAEEFSVRPTLPLYLPGEPVEIETVFHANLKRPTPLTVQISSYPEDQPAQKQTVTVALPSAVATVLPAPTTKGLHIIEARLLEGAAVRAIYHSAFWIRDKAYLRSGPRLSVNADYFQIDERPLAVVGTTYMSSEVQRLYFDHPNVYVWNADLALIHEAGLNMVRTGWWTGWDKFCDEAGRPYERTLRTLEAFLMTARKHNIPLQFNFFAFLPEVLGGVNPYLDPQALRKQQALVGGVVARFHDVPFLAWDLINEPSFSKRIWQMRPNDDGYELQAWNAWLARKYPDRAALADAWNLPVEAVTGTVSLPNDQEFSARGMYVGQNSLRVYDYNLFAQEQFAGWVHGMRDVIRATGSTQPITVGQDEGGYVDRLSPAFFGPYVNFTANHTWWQDDQLLWDSLVAKQPGKAMLIQETGLQRQLNLDEFSRLTPEQEAALFERKVALSFVQGSGAIEWLWNTNSYMTEGNEVPIGALHADATEKPEATVLRDFAKFAAAASPYLQNLKQPEIAIVTSQAAQFSVQGEFQIEAQQKAVRALGYELHQPAYIIAESQIANLGSPKLVILPSAQALRESTWQALLTYVRNGGNLLVTGPVSRDEHWHPVDRLSPLGLTGHSEPLTMHVAHTTGLQAKSLKEQDPATKDELRFYNSLANLSYEQRKQQMLQYLDFEDGRTLKEIELGKGNIFWTAYPIELSEGVLASSTIYGEIAQRVGVTRAFTTETPIQQGILVYPVDLESSVLYVIESEFGPLEGSVSIKIHDTVSGADLSLNIRNQHAAMVLISKADKKIIAKYGF